MGSDTAHRFAYVHVPGVEMQHLNTHNVRIQY